MAESIITSVDPITFEYQDYSEQDDQLILTSSLDTAFTGSTDYIEYYVYDENQELIYPSETFELKDFSIRGGDVLLKINENLIKSGYDEGTYFVSYNFYRRRLASSITQKYYIDEISPSRTEIRLKTNQNTDQTVFNSFVAFQDYRDRQPYFVDFQLNFGNNRQVIGNNLNVTPTTSEDPLTLLVKLYEPLPADFVLKDQLWIVEEISAPQAYRVDFGLQEITDVDEDSTQQLQGPNFNLNITNEVGIASEKVSYSNILNTTQTSSLQQLQSLLQEKSIQINVDYEKRNEFIKFSSAEERLKNFYFKASLIESTQNTLSSSIYSITGPTTSSISFSSSKASLESIIDSTIENFDGYEYFLYFNSGSDASWPKSSSTLPYKLFPTGSTQVTNWYGSTNENNINYGGQILSASNYDQNNPDWLYRTIPEYLVEDPDNAQYELFIDMVGQHYDNIWLYTKDVTNKFNADNRLEYGISKDLVSDAIKEFGIKLYSNNYDKDDLYQAFLGITADGSTFPVANITGSSPLPGFELVKTQISASNAVIPQNDVLKRVYKRIYHNIPYLLKTKGTLQGLRTLISSFGIPSTILEAREYGSTPRASTAYSNAVPTFNYALALTGIQSVDTDFVLNTDWSASLNVPNSIQLRFQAETIHPTSTGPTNNNQVLFSTDGGSVLALEYNGSSGVTSPYPGAPVDEYYQYGSLKWYPNGVGSEESSIYLPFYNGDWYNVMINFTPTSSMELYAGAKSSDFQSTQQVGHYSSSIVATDALNYINSTAVNYGSAAGGYQFFSGSLQEIRYYSVAISESSFKDFILNPNSIVGNGVNGAPQQLAFRASLGGELYTGSLSIHPKVSGSWQE